MYHVELRQFPHVAHAFNLSAEDLERTVVGPWLRGDLVDLGDRRWAPERAKLTIYEGARLLPEEMGMGRSWSNARRGATEVTAGVLDAAKGPRGASVPDFKRAVLAECAGGRIGIHQVLWLANAELPERRVSERLALAEQAVWELLHQGQLTMLSGDGEPVAGEQWEPIMLAWATWSGGSGPSVFLQAAERADSP